MAPGNGTQQHPAMLRMAPALAPRMAPSHGTQQLHSWHSAIGEKKIVSYYQVFESFDISIYNANASDLSGLMAALPEWVFPPANSIHTYPWRIVWPYHPVISTGSSKVRSYNQEHLLFHKTHHFAIYHQVAAVHYEMANLFGQYFLTRPPPSVFQRYQIGHCWPPCCPC